jgi:hypothetical protein
LNKASGVVSGMLEVLMLHAQGSDADRDSR